MDDCLSSRCPPAALSAATQRSQVVAELEQGRFDLLIIGGGITGAGLARDAAARGLRVALVEAGDFAVGTSSRSSKLIHGGLRYLESLQFSVVRQSALERREIHEFAPHLAQPRWMVLPTRGRFENWGMGLAVGLYERLGEVAATERHRTWNADVLGQREPLLDRRRYPLATAYREYVTDDARLVLANLRAAAADGAVMLNHLRVCGFLRKGQRAIGVELRGHRGEQARVLADCIINATGPWVDELRQLEYTAAGRSAEAGGPSTSGLLHLSKGVHLTVSAARLPVQNLLMVKARDGRRMFIMRRGQVVLIGTTDTSFGPKAELWPEVQAEEVDYLLEPIERYFGAEQRRSVEVLSAWAGLRPLIAKAGTSDPGALSRKEELVVGPLGVLSIAGGKLTGYPAMARKLLARAEAELGLRRSAPAVLGPLPGGELAGDLDALGHELAVDLGLPEPLARRLLDLYGSEARDVHGLGAEPLWPEAPILRGEMAWAVTREGVVHLEDLIYRRLRLPLYSERTLSEAQSEVLARALQSRLAWSEAETRAQLSQLRARLAAERF